MKVPSGSCGWFPWVLQGGLLGTAVAASVSSHSWHLYSHPPGGGGGENNKERKKKKKKNGFAVANRKSYT